MDHRDRLPQRVDQLDPVARPLHHGRPAAKTGYFVCYAGGLTQSAINLAKSAKIILIDHYDLSDPDKKLM